MNKRKAIRRAVYITPLPGGKIVLLGALVMLVWSVWECAVRIDAMDGMTKAYFNLVRQDKITLREAIENIWNTPEARQDWLNPLYLSLIAAFSVFAVLFRAKRYSLAVFAPACIAILLYNPGDSLILNLLNLFETVKYAACGAIVFGSGLNAYAAIKRRKLYLKRLAERRKRERARLEMRKAQTRRLQAPSKSAARTTIPKRTHPARKTGMKL